MISPAQPAIGPLPAADSAHARPDSNRAQSNIAPFAQYRRTSNLRGSRHSGRRPHSQLTHIGTLPIMLKKVGAASVPRPGRRLSFQSVVGPRCAKITAASIRDRNSMCLCCTFTYLVITSIELPQAAVPRKWLHSLVREFSVARQIAASQADREKRRQETSTRSCHSERRRSFADRSRVFCQHPNSGNNSQLVIRSSSPSTSHAEVIRSTRPLCELSAACQQHRWQNFSDNRIKSKCASCVPVVSPVSQLT